MAKDELSPQQTMAGILAMLAAIREDSLPQDKPTERRKTEVILAEAGIPTAQIASILGKRQKTVIQTIYRSRKVTASEGADDNE